MSTVPQRPGGWWHDYVCPTHGIELDPAVGDGYRAPRLPPHRRAVRLRPGSSRAPGARPGGARLAPRPGPDGAADRPACAILAELRRLYAEVVRRVEPDSEPWMLRGKLFSQALTEAMWAVRIADAVIALAAGPARPRDQVADMLAAC